MSRVGIVATGVANLASVGAALRRAGADPVVVDRPEEVTAEDRLVLPGVGAFGPAMAGLEGRGLVPALRARVESGRPTLAICLGMQVLFEESEESPGVRGLGVAAGRLCRFPEGVTSPQFGWNQVHAPVGSPAIESGYYYFANSFRAPHHPPDWKAAWADHGGSFVAAVARGGVLACQFHPELSGRLGASLIEAWLREAHRW